MRSLCTVERVERNLMAFDPLWELTAVDNHVGIKAVLQTGFSANIWPEPNFAEEFRLLSREFHERVTRNVCWMLAGVSILLDIIVVRGTCWWRNLWHLITLWQYWYGYGSIPRPSRLKQKNISRVKFCRGHRTWPTIGGKCPPIEFLLLYSATTFGRRLNSWGFANICRNGE